jgi:C1A family cysteine protease
MAHAKIAGVIPAAPRVPSAKDLREAWWTIGNQGPSGACVGWATADGALRWHFVKAGQIAKTDRLSPRFQWMAAKEMDDDKNLPTTFIERDGTTIKAALNVARKYGAVRNRELPFRSAKLYGGSLAGFYTRAAQLKIATYHNLELDFTQIKAWIAHTGPVLVRVKIDKSWDAANTKAKSNLDVYDPYVEPEGHAVVLVGYTPERFIVRNSWGTAWGDKGFVYATFAYARAAFTESYGVILGK